MTEQQNDDALSRALKEYLASRARSGLSEKERIRAGAGFIAGWFAASRQARARSSKTDRAYDRRHPPIVPKERA